MSLQRRVASVFNALNPFSGGYDAINPRGRRRATGNRTVREDAYLSGGRRGALQESSADLARNYSVCQWMVRRHLDYVSSFRFHVRTGDDQLDLDIERLMEEDSRAENFDVAGKFGREKFFRLVEARRVLDGDCLVVKLNDGRVQGIQADLIKTPTTNVLPDEQWIDGVLTSQVGRALGFGVRTREGLTGTKEDRRVNSTDAIHFGFFDRFAADQVRGISPIVSALNPLRDAYENFDYALAKSKVQQLFALALFRDAQEAAAPVDEDWTNDQDGDGVADETKGTANEQPAEKRYKIDFGKGPILLDLEPGDKAQFLESNSPSSEFQAFMQMVLQCALKALDIPYSFYSEDFTNFFGSRAAWLHYDRAAVDKRNDQIEMRRNWTIFKIRQWIRDGRLTLPSGWRISDVKFAWIPRGIQFWNPVQEIRGAVAGIAAGLDTPQRVCQASDSDFFDNVDQIAEAMAYAKEKGVPLDFLNVSGSLANGKIGRGNKKTGDSYVG